MRNFRNSEIFKRVVPFTLAAVVLAGTVLGLFGMIFAYAAETNKNSAVSWDTKDIVFRDHINGDELGDYVSRGNLKLNTSYDLYVILNVDLSKIEEPEEKTIEKIASGLEVELNGPTDENDRPATGDFSPINTSKFQLDRSRIENDNEITGSKVSLPYRMKNVQITGHNNSGYAQLDVVVQYKDNGGKSQNEPLTPTRFRVAEPGSGGISDDDEDDPPIRNNNPTSDDDDTEVLTTPKMIVTGFDIPPVVNPGEEFQVTVTFMNNSKKKDMENVSMTLTPSDGVAIKNGVNKRHYVKIPRRASTSETFTLKASKELKAEALNMTVKFDYQYEQDNAYKDGSSEEVLSILAIPKEEEEDTSGTEGSISSFEILSIVPPDSLYPNEDGYVTVKVINKDHQYDASNVQLTIVGEGLVNSGNTEYHGALTHSTQAEIEMAIQFTEPGAHTLQAIVTYEDSVGKDEKGKPKVRINDLTKDFTVTVQESPDMGMDMGMGDMMGIGGADMGGMEFDENGMPVGGEGMEAPWYQNPVILGCAGGGVLVVAVVAVLLIRRARKKKAGDDDEDL